MDDVLDEKTKARIDAPAYPPELTTDQWVDVWNALLNELRDGYKRTPGVQTFLTGMLAVASEWNNRRNGGAK